ncbi:MAG: hypothetical protein DRN66_04035 [Candidatus Nanohalarchaeota archaeon]|nr:MAG: hypothetical protein DRN66_04035 [Candidatus Nanohaloarchaeota archaeon]
MKPVLELGIRGRYDASVKVEVNLMDKITFPCILYLPWIKKHFKINAPIDSMKKYRLLLLTPKRFAKTTKMILKEANDIFEVTHAFIEEVVLKIEGTVKITTVINGKEVDLTQTDYVFAKIDSFRKDRGYRIMKAFYLLGIRTNYPPQTINIVHDKFLTNMLLAKHGIITPKTYLANRETVSFVGKTLHFPIMLKLVGGSGGKGVMYIEDIDTLNSVVSSLESMKQTMLIQEFVKNKGDDIRIIVCHDEIIGSMKRVIKEKGTTRANIKCGNKGIKFEPSMALKRTAFKCAKLINADLCGADFIECSDGHFYCIELNINPGIVGLTEATEVNIAKRIVERIKLLLDEEREMKSKQ